MKEEERPKYVEEARRLLESVDLNHLVANHNNLKEIAKINRLAVIFTKFSSNDGERLVELLEGFQNWARRSTSEGTIKNRAVDMLQFIDRKIGEMSEYLIEPVTKEDVEKKKRKLQNEELWVQSNIQGDEEHVFIGSRDDKNGQKVHLVVGKTGELRIDPSDKPPGELLQRVTSITTNEGKQILSTKATLEFVEGATKPNNGVPNIYVTRVRRSGGPKGHFIDLILKNIGKEIALDIHWKIKAFGFEWSSPDESFELEPNQEKEVRFEISGTKVFTEPVHELGVVLEYKSPDSEAYFTRRELVQERVPSGAFFDLKVSTFHPPAVLVDDGFQVLSEPFQNGDRIEAAFRINTEDGSKQATIGLSGSLAAVLQLNGDDQIRHALVELAHQKLGRMARENNIGDYIFTSQEVSGDEPIGGFDAYVQLRDSIR